MSDTVSPPAPRPCASCPYRRDVPSGIWADTEYAKLPAYDEPTPFQPVGLFQCHQTSADDPRARVCSGWAGCHDMDQALAVRLAVADGRLDGADLDAVLDYVSPVELFASGAEAAEHGMAEIAAPNPDAFKAIAKIVQRRTDLIMSGVAR